MYAEAKTALKKMLDDLEPLQKLVKEMEGDLRSIADEQEKDATAPTSLEGIKYLLSFGKKKSEVIAVYKAELIKALGQETFMELAAVSIGDIHAYCNPKQVEKILAEDNTGPRSIKIAKNA
jgi:hypothetical protein